MSGRLVMARLWLEFAGLYMVLPAVLMAARLVGCVVPVLPLLWAAAFPASLYLVRCRGWRARELVGGIPGRRQFAGMAWRFVAAAVILSAGILLIEPRGFMLLPRSDPRLWALVMVFYPALSVVPQGILYRALFHARYAALFRGEKSRKLAAAAAFGLAHLVFANAWAVALTLAGGLFIDRTYRKSGSMLAANIEHAVYGQLAFTTGWGLFLYHGTIRLIEGAGA
ncbi:MAG: CPBP family glutamic-type intramembrane protease [Kiritimatiellae bacterium]|nr:CPBP family glutamic-type intramembrane protease [Kiritimatiellia bacterium]